MIKEDIISDKGFDRDYIEYLWQLNKIYYGADKLSWGMGKFFMTQTFTSLTDLSL
jgi:anti-sigma regulatory factor (Ser/Thr protein kinase)